MGYPTLKEKQKQAILYLGCFCHYAHGIWQEPAIDTYLQCLTRCKNIKGSVLLLYLLMKHQVDFFLSKGLAAIKADRCSKESYRDIVNGKYQLVFISSEAILSHKKWRRLLLLEVYQKNLVALVIDEAHCVRNCMVCYMSQ